MAGITSKRFRSPEETRTPDKTRVDAWIVGTEPFVGFEFESTTADTYATPGR